MVTIQKAREILGSDELSDQEVQKLLDTLSLFARIEIEHFQSTSPPKKRTSKTKSNES